MCNVGIYIYMHNATNCLTQLPNKPVADRHTYNGVIVISSATAKLKTIKL